jgi:hypothetical protein
MKQSPSKLSLSAAALFTFAFVMAAPAARADDYCITNGAQAAHGCGYSSMEACRAAASGIGGMCSQSGGSSASPSDAMAKVHHGRSKPHKNQATGS